MEIKFVDFKERVNTGNDGSFRIEVVGTTI